MRKLYTLISAVLLTATGYTQHMQQGSKSVTRMMVERGQQNDAIQQLPANREVIWTNDLSDENDWAIDNAFNNGFDEYVEDLNFVIGTDEPSGPAAIDPIESTTADNGFALVDSDLFGGEEGGDGIENCWIETVMPISTVGYDNVSLKFETYYRMWDAGTADGNEYCLVELSHDGVNWPDVTTYEVGEEGDGLDGARLELWPDMETQDPVNNPTLKIFNITDFGAQQDSLFVRFRWKGTFGYAWMIDDVEIFETPENDLTLNSTYRGDIINDWDIYSIPDGQQKEMTFGAALSNHGINDMDTTVTFDITGAETYTEAVEFAVASGTSDTLWAETTFTPETVGEYTVTVSVPADDFPQGNELINGFERTEFVFGHNSAIEPYLSRGFDDNGEVAIGCQIQMVNDASVGGIIVAFAEGTTAPQEVQINIYEAVEGDIQDTEFLGTGVYNIQEEDIDGDPVLIPLEGAVDVYEGLIYIIEVRKYAGSDRIYVASNVQDEDFSTVNYGDFGSVGENWYLGYNWTPWVEMYLDPSVNIQDPVSTSNVTLGQNMPNPAFVNTTINFALNEAVPVSFQLFDVMGRKVMDRNEGTLGQGQHNVVLDVSALSAGIYSYTMTAGNEQLTKQMIIK